MIHRPNYFLARELLAYLSEVMQLNPSSVGRYWSYMKHLLVWAYAAGFAQAPSSRPTFTSYLAATGQNHTQSAGLAGLTLKKILQTAKRFFKWLKSTYPQQYRHLSPAWIEALRLPRAARPVEEREFVKLD